MRTGSLLTEKGIDFFTDVQNVEVLEICNTRVYSFFYKLTKHIVEFKANVKI